MGWFEADIARQDGKVTNCRTSSKGPSEVKAGVNGETRGWVSEKI